MLFFPMETNLHYKTPHQIQQNKENTKTLATTSRQDYGQRGFSFGKVNLNLSLESLRATKFVFSSYLHLLLSIFGNLVCFLKIFRPYRDVYFHVEFLKDHFFCSFRFGVNLIKIRVPSFLKLLVICF